MTNSPFHLYNYFNIGIIDDTVTNCRNNFKKLLNDNNITITTLHNADFTTVCDTKNLKYNPTERKFLLYEPLPTPNKTVFFSNTVDGWYTAIYNYTRLFHREAYLPGFTITLGNSSPAYFFRHFKSIGDKVEERRVHLIKEDRWIFYEASTPLDIEDTSNYQKRKKTDRLNNEIILDYLKKAGYDLMNSSFYETNKDASLFKCN